MMKKILLASLFLFVVGCASFLKRQECDKINWYKHGEEIALRGEWLNADTQLNECRAAEAEISESKLDQGFKAGREKYCTTENSYAVGRVGDGFSKDLCDSPQQSSLISSHKRGLNDYCSKANGYNAGVSGKKYKNNCSLDLEAGFLPEYKKGRLKYVQSQIQILEQRRRDDQTAISNKHIQLSGARTELNSYQMRRTWLESQRSFALSANNQSEVFRMNSEIDEMSRSITNSQSSINRIQGDITQLENDQRQIDQQVTAYKNEMAGL
ncbi:MAG: DUF2799 domain-containing protein [Bdellovibrio sp.]